jgi:malonyl CoA-acyl carrier protein transacylase
VEPGGGEGRPSVGSISAIFAEAEGAEGAADAVPKRTAREAVEALIEQVSAPVRWQAVVEWLVKDGVTRFVELGPGTVLAGLIRKIDRGVAVVSVGDGVTAEALAQLSGEAGGVSYD